MPGTVLAAGAGSGPGTPAEYGTPGHVAPRSSRTSPPGSAANTETLPGVPGGSQAA